MYPFKAEWAYAPANHQTHNRRYKKLVNGGRGQTLTTRNQAMEIIRSLIDYIELVPVGGELKARIHGDIAGLFNFMSHKKSPTASADRGVSFEMVAGAGSQREPRLRTTFPKMCYGRQLFKHYVFGHLSAILKGASVTKTEENQRTLVKKRLAG